MNKQEQSEKRMKELTVKLHATVQEFLKDGNSELTTNEITNVCLKLGHGYNKYQIEVDNMHDEKENPEILESKTN